MKNYMKTILNGLQSWTKGKIKDSTADWNQNDPNAVDYVKNRTHYKEEVSRILIPEKTVIIVDDEPYACLSESLDMLTAGKTYYVVLNGIKYECVARTYNDCVLIGNGTVYGDGYTANNEPFCCDSYEDDIYLNAAAGEYTISISGPQTIVHKLDSKYLDLPTNLATTDDVQEAVDIANTAQSIANDKMNKSNPVGTGSFSMNRKSGTTVGTNSVALGYNVTASGNYSHAEGNFTHATTNIGQTNSKYTGNEYGYSAHAEGYGTVSYGAVSHAEGNSTKASGNTSHAEGTGTLASGNTSHAEGYYTVADGSPSHAEGSHTKASGNSSHAQGDSTKASGNTSHAEGTGTLASGNTSHAEGCGTVAQRSHQHVQGIYNVIDTEGANANVHGAYAHIVGNGTSDTKRSNAHTLDWNGVGWFQGGLQVGGNAQDDGAKNVMLEGNAYDYFILNDVNTGTPYKIQIIDGNLVSSAMTIETEPTTINE